MDTPTDWLVLDSKFYASNQGTKLRKWKTEKEVILIEHTGNTPRDKPAIKYAPAPSHPAKRKAPTGLPSPLEFKKEQLKVNISKTGILSITGERNVDATKRSRFYKELKTPKECIWNDIRAQIENGLLYIVMPKKPAVVPERKLTLQEQFQVDEDPKPTQDQVAKSKALNDIDSASVTAKTKKPSPLQEDPTTAGFENGKTATKFEFQPDSSTSRYRKIAKVAMKATAAAAFISVYSALVVYVYKVYVCAE
ncbi:hypothetical protein RJ639_046558 [Escallonia herrerae]|uniref:SHSP domain-containing protein n=1 Tax=Escallonia herrerae TaxID=1293975 RepID=A0AA88W6V7_9ASTE|nr:hypothetical protein RJ639_046558 [Escallonia herrerae]